MNYIFMICTNDYLSYARKCMATLPKDWSLKIIFKYFCPKPWESEIYFGEIFWNIEITAILFEDWHDQIAYRKVMLLHRFAMNRLEYNDKVLVIDADLKFKCDPFDVFDMDANNSDIYYTKRYYKYHFPINEGFWGFQWNDRSKNFIQFYRDQIENPTWEPYIRWLKRYWHWGQKNWGIGQDFFCALWEGYYNLPFEHKLEKYPLMKMLSPQWNYCPSVEENDLENTLPNAIKEMKEAENNPDVKVLHYKGRLKEMM